ncbi:hypothetical protein E2C01_046749 [Portunus trituberculatus]|uniref:Uncharacterized protein n=1 Tax=Portunus trituberculatus TaxID=210409 RepID=A0A5B7FYM3_PORTR|nr:hypothetical protein [Portunus trituberculatus]
MAGTIAQRENHTISEHVAKRRQRGGSVQVAESCGGRRACAVVLYRVNNEQDQRHFSGGKQVSGLGG